MWIRNPELRHLVYATCTLLLSRQALAQQACLAMSQASQRQQTVYEQAVSINTYVQTNTTFFPIPQVGITVNNAPTSLDGVTTFRYTETQTTMKAAGISSLPLAATTTPKVALDSYVLLVRWNPGNQDRRKIHSKRQSGNFYVSADGTISNDCTTSPIYTVSGGVLTASVQGTIYTYSTSPGVQFEQFAPSTIPGSIKTTFSLGSGGSLNWQNGNFYNGQAAFCSLQN
ncbi:hypothetical protein LTR53_018124, partial [Teratosphaeriaceae sp. CCFEE 6253]